jgi:hypothetical protein
MNWHFRTLGMGSVNYRSASKRLAMEAKKTGLFISSEGLNERHLRRILPKFWEEHGNVLRTRVPGYGWWVWKPHFILHSLESIPEGDGLLYLDAGSVIKSDEESLLVIHDYLRLASAQKILGSNSDSFPEELYTTRELMDYYRLTDFQRQENQYCAAILFVINDNQGRALVREWSEMICKENHRWLLPTSKESSNHKKFIHHMHDQAILSCLLKRDTSISVFTGNNHIDGPIRLARHRYGYKYGESRKYIRFYFGALYLFSRLSLALQRRIFRNSLIVRPNSHEINIP